jgi:Domain of unknown function (DUF4188)
VRGFIHSSLSFKGEKRPGDFYPTGVGYAGAMAAKISRQTTDLSAYPDLVVIYLGMRAYSLKGLRTLLRIGPQIARAVAERPDGLLRHEDILFSLLPPHFGMRQYWRDFDSLERWSHSLPHKKWWLDFLKDTGGTTFWHETYFARGGVECIFDDLKKPIGLSAFAPLREARGPMFSARKRALRDASSSSPAVVSESDLYQI